MSKLLPTLKFWQVDAFTSQVFKGNPAAVFLLEEELDSSLMQNIAIEMALSETAFVVMRGDLNPYIRWFTPMSEIDLCGHATLSAAHIIMTEKLPDVKRLTFDTKFVGELTVEKSSTAYTMNFSSRLGEKQDLRMIPDFVLNALTTKARPHTAYKARDLMLVYDNEDIIHTMTPNFSALLPYEDFIIVTAKSQNSKYDFVSRFFCAADGIAEDPVTGSAHCTLAPYWGHKLQKRKLSAFQASKRGGELQLELRDERVMITGKAVTVMDGTFRGRN